MKMPPLNTKLRTYDEFDCEDNPALKGELTLMFGQLAMCINPSAQYGGAERILWAVVGDMYALQLKKIHVATNTAIA